MYIHITSQAKHVHSFNIMHMVWSEKKDAFLFQDTEFLQKCIQNASNCTRIIVIVEYQNAYKWETIEILDINGLEVSWNNNKLVFFCTTINAKKCNFKATNSAPDHRQSNARTYPLSKGLEDLYQKRFSLYAVMFLVNMLWHWTTKEPTKEYWVRWSASFKWVFKWVW